VILHYKTFYFGKTGAETVISVISLLLFDTNPNFKPKDRRVTSHMTDKEPIYVTIEVNVVDI
jgi:hypothetical protein